MKAAIFHPKDGLALQEFPEDVRRELGKAIFDLQKGHKLHDVILVFHAFQKKAQKTPKHEITLGQKRLKELTDEKI